MKSNKSKNKINIFSFKHNSNNLFTTKTEKKCLPNNNIIIKSQKDEIEKLKIEKKIFSKKNFNTNSNSQLLIYKSIKENSNKLPNNISIFQNKQNNEETNMEKKDSFSLSLKFSLNKSQSINNLKNIFPIIHTQKNKIFSYSKNSHIIPKDKSKWPKYKRPTIERNFLFNFLNNNSSNTNNTAKSSNNFINLKSTKYKFIVRPENCGYLIVNCFKHRKNWQEIKNDYDNQNFNFKWQQNIKNIYYNTLSNSCGYKQMVNHFEFHNVLTNKANLFYNMMKYAEIVDENVFKFIPFTILFEYNNDNFFKKIEKFQLLFNNIQNYLVKYDEINHMKFKHIKGRSYSSFFPFDNYLGNKTAINIVDTHLCIFDDNDKDINGINDEDKNKKKNLDKNKKIYNNNLWLIKAPNLNRGMCIKILNDFNLIQKYITYYNRGISLGYNNNDEKKNEKRNKSLNKKKLINLFEQDKKENIYQSSTIVLQKYIEKPLLYFGRKFDIRIWVLLTQDLKVYVFNEGHLKCCSVKYDLNCNDIYSHLTNYSFQKYNNYFGKYEYGNEVSFDDLQNNIDLNYNHKINFKREILPKIYNIVKFCFQSVRSKINSMKRKYTFEIFGFDFMIDCNFEPFLIEINTNPGLEESSPLIKMIVPRMLDDALRLTVDKEFDTIYDFDGIEVHSNDKNSEIIYQSPFPVYGHLNSENIFKFVCDLTLNEKSKKKNHRTFHFN